MLKSLKELFNPDTPSEAPTDHDLKLAAATLMYEVVRSDGQVDEIELKSMSKLLQREFKLSDEELSELSSLAKTSSEEAISFQGFTRDICDAWDNSKRIKLLEYLWVVALADDKIDPHERHLVRKVAGLLYLTDTEIVVSRENAKRRLQVGLNK